MITHITVEDAAKLISRLTNANKMQALTYIREAADRGEIQAATALSTLQAENAQLRADLEYEREHADAYYEECGQWEAENEKLRVEAEGMRSNWYKSVEEIKKLRAELEKVKRDRDAARSDIETALAYGMKDCELCKNSQCYVRGGTKPCLPKWRGQKED